MKHLVAWVLEIVVHLSTAKIPESIEVSFLPSPTNLAMLQTMQNASQTL